MNTNTPNPYIIPGAVIVAALIIAGAVIYGPHGASTGDNIVAGGNAGGAVPAAAANVDAKDVDVKGDPFIGKANAPLTVVYWFDYQCPFCHKFDKETLGQVVTNYVNTGKIKVVFKDFQFLGQDSYTMAVAARAVWEAYPDKYYAWREAIVNNAGDENSGYATPQFMSMVYSKVPGISEAKINALIAKNGTAYRAAIDADKQLGQQYGVNGTPGILVGNQKISGAASYATFTSKLDPQLK
jgi:protein-disulfide isomerase